MAELRDGNLVEKSKRLVWARFNHYTAGEMRLLETYLSRFSFTSGRVCAIILSGIYVPV